jgi:hypothetical protein
MKRRVSRKLKEQKVRSAADFSWPFRVLLWLISSDVKIILFFAAIFTIVMTLTNLDLSIPSDLAWALKVASIFFVIGVFIAVVVITDDDRRYRNSGQTIRVVCGAMAGALIGMIVALPFGGIVSLALIGTVLGFFAKDWAQYV